MAESIYQLLAQISKRPAMWFGASKISLLEAFLNGYFYGQGFLNHNNDEMPPFGLINDWTAIKFNQGRTTAGWCHILTEKCRGDEVEAFQLFFEILEEFKEVRAVRAVRISLNPNNLAFYNSDACEVRRYNGGSLTDLVRLPAPDTIFIVHFSGGLGYYVFHHLDGQRVNSDCYYLSLRAALKQLRREFGSTLNIKESLDLSATTINSIMKSK